MFFVAKDGEALYSQQKQDRECTVALIMNKYAENQQERQDSNNTLHPTTTEYIFFSSIHGPGLGQTIY